MTHLCSSMIYQLKVVILQRYVKLPDGNGRTMGHDGIKRVSLSKYVCMHIYAGIWDMD